MPVQRNRSSSRRSAEGRAPQIGLPAKVGKPNLAKQIRRDAGRPCNGSRAYAFAVFAAFTMISATGFGCET